MVSLFKPKTPEYSFCEGSLASSSSRWHIRQVSPKIGLKFSGGIDTSSLCGHVQPNGSKKPNAVGGWDLETRITAHHLASRHVGPKCVEIYKLVVRGRK